MSDMPSLTLPQPGMIWGIYPEKRRATEVSIWTHRINTLAEHLIGTSLRRYEAIARHSLEIEQGLVQLSGGDFDECVRGLKQRFGTEGLTSATMAQAFALTSDACRRHLGMQAFVSQRIAAAIMLENQLAEMATGEGKTLAAALTAATAAMAGIPVHVITANDYLVSRDAHKLRPIYAALGLNVGAIQQNMNSHRRRQEYANDITYCTAKELVFDYLRDLPVRSQYRTDLAWHAANFSEPASSGQATLLRGLCMAIIDEADSILIDEARVPLIISEMRVHEGRRDAATDIFGFAQTLRHRIDFIVSGTTQVATLTAAGRAALDQKVDTLHPVWRNRRHREDNLCVALAALHLFHRDHHYLVRDGGVHIVDETTGRVASGRTWSRGLHQFIELKEQCKLSGETVTRAQITYQRFFPRYLRFCGMSGTLAESSAELARVYGRQITRVPLRKPSLRSDVGQRVFLRRTHQWQALAKRLSELVQQECPVLIGTDSVAESESMSTYLTQQGISHIVLNARNDQQESDVIANAGQRGRVTVTTNMAGRGTDIPLGPGVSALGGLHVISCQMNSARRIDRQLMGRGARQGDPGQFETLLSLESALMQRSLPTWLSRLVTYFAAKQTGELPRWLGKMITAGIQRHEESRQQQQRAMLLRQDLQLDRLAIFKE